MDLLKEEQLISTEAVGGQESGVALSMKRAQAELQLEEELEVEEQLEVRKGRQLGET
jgi:hypothetical protein